MTSLQDVMARVGLTGSRSAASAIRFSSTILVCALVCPFNFLVRSAKSDGVISRPVGFVRISIAASNQVLSSTPFVPFDGRLGRVVGSQLTGGSDWTESDVILKWAPDAQHYLVFWRDTGGSWYQYPEAVETTNTLRPGEAFWLVNYRNYTQVVFLAGSVVLHPSYAVSIQPALNAIGFPYSSRIALPGPP